MQPEDSKEYSWKWITVDSLLSKRPCEICTVILTCDGTECYAILYNGENAQGEIAAIVRALGNQSCAFSVHHHIYCRRGLYIDVETDAHVTGLFVQWREVPQGVGYP